MDNLVPTDQFLIYLSLVQPPYMVKVGQNLKIFYSYMVHVTCLLLHEVNRIAELVRTKYLLVTKLISNVKKHIYECNCTKKNIRP